MVATIKDPMDDSVEDGSDAGEGSSDEENLSDGFETVQRSGRSGGYGDEEPDFSDPEGFVDDIDDEGLMPELLRQKPKESDGMDSVIVIDGIPAVASERLDKLKGVVRKIYSRVSFKQKILHLCKLYLCKKNEIVYNQNILFHIFSMVPLLMSITR